MADPFIGQITVFGFPFAPRGWAICRGQLMPIAQNVALFQVIGNRYGGNGVSTFALPDLQGRAALEAGQGVGLSAYSLGDSGGTPAVGLSRSQMPGHAHAFSASTAQATAQSPEGRVLARPVRVSTPEADVTAPGPQPGPKGIEADCYSRIPGNATTALTPGAIAPAGGGEPHNNMQPYLTLNFCIALQGVMPTRP